MRIGGERWPDFFIVGAHKAGTTALYEYLRQHPGIFMPRVKEPCYFSQVTPDPRWRLPVVNDRAEYLNLFRGAPDQATVGEASTLYLLTPEAPARIKTAAPDAKLLVVLRDPVERAFSEYGMHVREAAPVPASFYQALIDERDRGIVTSAVPYIEGGMYSQQLTRVFDVFDREQVLVLLAEDLKQKRLETLVLVARFLGVDPRPMERVEQGRHNAYARPRNRLGHFVLASNRPVAHVTRRVIPERVRRFLKGRVLLREAAKPEIEPAAQALLQSCYEKEMRDLEVLLGRPLPELRRSWIPAQHSPALD